jgi:hypothetical protein
MLPSHIYIYSKIIAHGEFICPKCGTKRGYEHKRRQKRITAISFYGSNEPIPLDDIIQCTFCHKTFSLDVLDDQPEKLTSKLKPVVKIAKKRFDDGLPVEFVVRSLHKEGFTNDEISTVIQAAVGKERLICNKCSLLYPTTKTICHECRSTLEVYQP